MSRKQKVVVADLMHEDGITMLRGHFDVSVFSVDSRDACLAALADADALIVRTFEVPAAVLDAAPNLAAVIKHGAGVDNIDVAAATARGILVANSGDANATSVAEATVGLMFAALRRTPQMHEAVIDGRYNERWGLLLEGICGKTLGIVGFGNIGRRVAAMCRAGFGMKVVVYDPFVPADAISSADAQAVESLAELCSIADIVSVNASSSKNSACLIGAKELALMKPNAVLVNTARGGVVDEIALADALREGRLFGAGLDVFAQEPPSEDNPLLKLQNVVLSPHIGGATSDTRKLMSTRSAEAAIACLGGGTPAYWLNPEVRRKDLLKRA